MAKNKAADPEAELREATQALQDEMQGEGKIATRAKPPKRTKEEIEFQEEMRDLQRSAARDLKKQADWAATRRKGLPPTSSRPILRQIDPTIARYSNGKPVEREGRRLKWVPDRDTTRPGEGANHQHNVYQHEHEGFEPVMDIGPDGKPTGEPVKGIYGTLMGIKPRDAAVRVMARSVTGAVSPEEYFAAEVASEIRSFNAQERVRAGVVTKGDSHGITYSDSLETEGARSSDDDEDGRF